MYKVDEIEDRRNKRWTEEEELKLEVFVRKNLREGAHCYTICENASRALGRTRGAVGRRWRKIRREKLRVKITDNIGFDVVEGKQYGYVSKPVCLECGKYAEEGDYVLNFGKGDFRFSSKAVLHAHCIPNFIKRLSKSFEEVRDKLFQDMLILGKGK